jgi:hypothetical protein
MIATIFGFGNSNGADKLSVPYLWPKPQMYSIAFIILIAVIVLIPVFLCVIPCSDAFRNWEYKPSSKVHEDALEEVGTG